MCLLFFDLIEQTKVRVSGIERYYHEFVSCVWTCHAKELNVLHAQCLDGLNSSWVHEGEHGSFILLGKNMCQVLVRNSVGVVHAKKCG